MSADDPFDSHAAAEQPRFRLRLEQITDWETRAVEAMYSPKALCVQCGFSMRHMQRFILKKFDVSLREYVAGIRMTKARNLLRSGFSIKETSIGLGFKQVSHFCRSFKGHFGVSPSVAIRSAIAGAPDVNADGSQLELDFVRGVSARRKARVPASGKKDVKKGKGRKRPKED